MSLFICASSHQISWNAFLAYFFCNCYFVFLRTIFSCNVFSYLLYNNCSLFYRCTYLDHHNLIEKNKANEEKGRRSLTEFRRCRLEILLPRHRRSVHLHHHHHHHHSTLITCTRLLVNIPRFIPQNLNIFGFWLFGF